VTRYDVINRLCPKCLGVKVKDYNAVLQVRFTGGPPRELINEVARMLIGSRGVGENVTDYEEVQGGINVKFSDASVARQAAIRLQNSLGGYLTESWKLHGLVKGRRHGKLFVVLRIPVFTSGDLIDLRGRLFEVLNVKGEKVTVRQLSDGKLLNLSVKSLVKEGFRQLGRDDYVTTECLVTEALGKEAVAVCEDGATVKWEVSRPLKAGDRVLALTYKDVRYLRY
ncbi:MAG: NMD3-related protein, partial [Zestosphaera sp.]